MDYKVKIKERLGKLLFLEMNKDGFKENIGIPSYVTFKNKDLYLPISSEYISSNINDEIKIKNLPIYYFIDCLFNPPYRITNGFITFFIIKLIYGLHKAAVTFCYKVRI